MAWLHQDLMQGSVQPSQTYDLRRWNLKNLKIHLRKFIQTLFVLLDHQLHVMPAFLRFLKFISYCLQAAGLWGVPSCLEPRYKNEEKELNLWLLDSQLCKWTFIQSYCILFWSLLDAASWKLPSSEIEARKHMLQFVPSAFPLWHPIVAEA